MPTCLWLTGLPSAGKTTIAELVRKRYPDADLLDGDEVRKFLSKGLGFIKEDRIENNQRIAYVAAKVMAHGGDVIVAAVSPFAEGREIAREMIEPHGAFVEVHVHASAETCKKRDPKGNWKKAALGLIDLFTGYSDPYEEPENPDVRLDTDEMTAEACAEVLCAFLVKRPRQLFIGRWQPFHDGHRYIIEQAIEKGPVAVGVRDTELSDSDPFSVAERIATIRKVLAGHDVEVFRCPDISSVNIGRKVGYDIVRYDVPGHIAAISGTKIREGLAK
jgi:adenylylsulfate kinase